MRGYYIKFLITHMERVRERATEGVCRERGRERGVMFGIKQEIGTKAEESRRRELTLDWVVPVGWFLLRN